MNLLIVSLLAAVTAPQDQAQTKEPSSVPPVLNPPAHSGPGNPGPGRRLPQSWYAVTLGPWIGYQLREWGSRQEKASIGADGGAEAAFWFSDRTMPVALGVDIGIGSRGIYSELQAVGNVGRVPLGLSVGVVHPWNTRAGPLGFQGTLWTAVMVFVPYVRVEAYGAGTTGIVSGGLLFKFPVRYTGPI